MKISLNRNLQIGYGFSLIILIAVSAICYISIRTMLAAGALVDHSNLVIQKLDSTISVIKDVETGVRGYLLTHRDEFLEPYSGSAEKAWSLVNELKALTTDNPRQQENIDSIRVALETRLSVIQKMLRNEEAGRSAQISDLVAGKIAMDALRQSVKKAEGEEKRLLSARLSRYLRYTGYVPVVVGTAALFALAISIISYVSVSRIIKERQKMQAALFAREQETAELNEELAAANEEMTAINEELRTSNEELAESRSELFTLNSQLEEKIFARTGELTVSENRFRMIMQTLPQIAWTNTAAGQIDFYNRQWFSYTGLEPEQTKGEGWRQVIHPDDIDHNLERFQEIIVSGEPGEFEVRERRYDGEYRWHLVRMAPLRNDSGQIQLWVGTATDIEEMKQLQQQKDDFINIVSHELKTPLTSLKSTIQLLESMKEKLTPEKLEGLIERAGKSVNRITFLVEDLLYIGKLNQGQLELNISTFKLMDMIRESCSHIRISGEFQITFTGDEELLVTADAERIEQVILNFVSNAIKYAPLSRSIHVNVTDDEVVRVSVTDYGPGIAKDKLPFLFKRYYRVHAGGSQYSGLGIGLYISSEIIKRHGGEIGVDSKVGEGSTFWFTLPHIPSGELPAD
ncbi:MAG TPA: CHASE3 domain-containing protein [Mucilaginibacter sp.]